MDADAPQEPAAQGRPALWVAAVMAALHLPLFLGRAIVDRDLDWWTTPSHRFVGRMLRAGELPGWNPWLGLGTPVLADPLHGVFYPGNAVAFALGSAWGSTFTMWLHAVLGGVGMVRLARAFGRSPAACAVAGIAWAASGVVLSEWTAGVRALTLAWMPWCALGAVALARAPLTRRAHARAVLALAVPLGLALLTGELFLAFLAGVLAVSFAAAEVLADDVARRARVLATVARVAAAGALALLLGAPAWLTALAGVAQTDRATALPKALAQSDSLHPLRLFDLAVSSGFGLAARDLQQPAILARVGHMLLFTPYAGAVTLGLALAAPWRDARVRFWTALALVATLGALGRFTPLYDLLALGLQPLRYMRGPEKLLGVTIVPLGLLAAAGFDRVRDRAPGLARDLAPTALVPALVVAFLAYVGVALPDMAPFAAGGAAASLATFAAGLGLLALAKTPRARALGLLAALTLDLGLFTARCARYDSTEASDWQPPTAAILRRRFAPARGVAPVRVARSDDVDALDPSFPREMVPYHARATLHANVNVALGVGSLPGYDVAASPAIRRLFAANPWGALRLFAVDAVLLRQGPDAVPGAVAFATAGPGVVLFDVADSLPRVYAAGAASVVPDAHAERAVFAPDVLRGERVLLAPGARPREGAARRAGECRLVRMGAGAIDARCALTAPGHAVFVEQYAPGWSARVDDRPASLVRANVAVMAVPVPAGEHVVSLRFASPGLRAALVAWCAGVLVALALAASRWRGERAGQ